MGNNSVNRRQALSAALIAGPAAMLANTPQGDRPRAAAKPIKVTGIEVLHLEKALKERFWMANAPIGGYQPTASRLILKLHTEPASPAKAKARAAPTCFARVLARS